MKSPLSASPPRKIRDLPRTFILEQLESYYQARPPLRAVVEDYSVWQCSETGLEFAWPMSPGNDTFYEWVSSFNSYYPQTRWEHSEVRNFLDGRRKHGEEVSKILDVGCGKGNFLRTLDLVPFDRRFGLDLNERGVEECRRTGFKAFCGTVDDALKAGFVRRGEFSVVTSFHCLEHVDDPVEFVRALADITAPGGRIFLSTPYSPMSFEADWFDVLNYPPHHLTRWNVNAYGRLAAILGLKMQIYFPASSLTKQLLAAFRLLQYGPYRRVRRMHFYRDLIRHFPVLVRSYRAQRERARNNGGITSDVILVELAVPVNPPTFAGSHG